jgi:hypothetical protein
MATQTVVVYKINLALQTRLRLILHSLKYVHWVFTLAISVSMAWSYIVAPISDSIPIWGYRHSETLYWRDGIRSAKNWTYP